MVNYIRSCVGALAATAVGAGFIWRMYYQIDQALKIRVSTNILKSISSALLTNLVTGLSGVLVWPGGAL